MRAWLGFGVGWLMILLGASVAHLTQSSNGTQVSDIRFTTVSGKTLSALLYVPASATPSQPAPAILAVHGYINSRETQSAFAIEYARRGFVVLALDQTGHGYSDGPAFAEGFGGPAALQYLRSLDVVDTDNIGLEGHSMGGWAILAAAAAMPADYRAMVLEGSSTGPPFAADGTPSWPRNLAVVFSEFDEFSELMWGVGKGRLVPTSSKLQALFGTDSTVNVGKLYGDIARGDARVLYQPAVTHPGDHISHEAVAHSLDWFGQTFDGGIVLPSSDQIWLRKELATLLALIGWVVMLLGTFNGLLRTRFFVALNLQPTQSTPIQLPPRGLLGWALTLISFALPAISFYPLFALAEMLLPPSAWLPQGITNQVVFWAVMTALIGVMLNSVIGRSLPTRKLPLVHTLCLVLVTMLVSYFAVWVVGKLLLVDFRFWVVGLKALSAAQAKMVLVYFWPLLLYFLLMLRGLHFGLHMKLGLGNNAWSEYAGNVWMLTGGLLLLLLLQYGWLFGSGALLTPSQPLNTIIMIQFVPLLLIVALISTFLFRRTGSYVPGALTNALFVTWYVVAGQATQYGV